MSQSAGLDAKVGCGERIGVPGQYQDALSNTKQENSSFHLSTNESCFLACLVSNSAVALETTYCWSGNPQLTSPL